MQGRELFLVSETSRLFCKTGLGGSGPGWSSRHALSIGGLGNQVLNDAAMDISKAEVSPLEAIGKRLVIDAQKA